MEIGLKDLGWGIVIFGWYFMVVMGRYKFGKIFV